MIVRVRRTLGAISALARAEARLCRRLVRYWVFVALAFGSGLVLVGQYTALHWFSSWRSATAAAINPRYLVSAYGGFYLAAFLAGIVFLGFDVRGRDVRERIAEVVDTRPFSNLELLAGKLLGLVGAAWLPVLGASVVFWVITWLAGSPIQPVSLVAFATFMALPALAFVAALTFCITLVVRHRGAAAALLLAVLAAGVFGLRRIPMTLATTLDVTGGYVLAFPSDLLPRIAEPAGWLQRAALLSAAAGLLVLAAALHPRRDDGRRAVRGACGVLLIALAAGGLYAAGRTRAAPIEVRADARRAHEARSGEPVPDIRSIRGRIALDPGRDLAADLTVVVRAPAGRALSRALFTLNPGFAASLSVRGPGGATLGVETGQGLCTVALPAPLAPGTETTLSFAYRGRPDPGFPYLDAALEPLRLTPQDGAMLLLGWESLVFERRIVVLPSGARILPASGPETGRDDPRTRPPDPFELELTVDVPEGWLVAGPGRRREESGAATGLRRFRFAPGAPVRDPALVAGPFDARSVEAAGVRCEVLVDRAHVKNLDILAEAADEIRRFLVERFDEAKAAGLPYPLDGLTLVEVPNALRGYCGGWRMGTTLAAPGLVMMRESGFPTARFDNLLRDKESLRAKEGGVPRAVRDRLVTFFENDFSGGNPWTAFARTLLLEQCGATGPDAVALDWIVEDLAMQSATGRRGYFSAHVFGRRLDRVINSALGSYFSAEEGERENFSQSVIRTVTQRPEVWDAALRTSLGALDPVTDPTAAIDVLTLKAGGLARVLLEGEGRDRTGKTLRVLRERHAGGAFTRADLVAAGAEAGLDLGTFLHDALDTTVLPGLRARDVSLVRLADLRDGTPQYQLRATVQNDENAAGLFRLNWFAQDPDAKRRIQQNAGPWRVGARAAVEVGVISPRPIESATIAPYLALNRVPFALPLPALDAETRSSDPPFTGVRDAASVASDEKGVVVDDLDAGFRTEESAARGWLRLAGSPPEGERDGGLPVAGDGWRAPQWWTRMAVPRAFGRYRRTVALVAAGSGRRAATFEAVLPSAGSYTLEVSIPQKKGPPWVLSRDRGRFHYTIAADGVREDVTFNAEAAEEGWNPLGTYDLPAGPVTVRLTDKTSGDFVLADAIRWRPAS